MSSRLAPLSVLSVGLVFASPAAWANTTTAQATPVRENTLMDCKDTLDNDLDGHVDCGDQDCQIFVMCMAPPAPRPQAAQTPPAPPPQAPPPQAPQTPYRPLEDGQFCKDNLDNDGNGLIDCFDPPCQRYKYCQNKMYYYPEEDGQTGPKGPFIGGGLGVAFRNYRKAPSSTYSSRYDAKMPFKPDLGAMGIFEFGYLPSRFFGVGGNLTLGGSYATNREAWTWEDVNTSGLYKYYGYKGFGHVGGFLRLQLPVGRVVPLVDFSFGYSYIRYRWDIWDARRSWSYIDDHMSDPDVRLKSKYDHFTFAVKPGLDFYTRKRTVAIGLRFWLPTYASENPETDNMGFMITCSSAPSWRKKKQLRPEYARPPAPPVGAAGPMPAPHAAQTPAAYHQPPLGPPPAQ